MYVVSGCNGSGKSTFMRSVGEFESMPTVDPDAMFVRLRSWRLVLAHLDDLIERRNDFVVETTLSGRRMMQRMRAVRASGFYIVMIFIGTSSPALNVGRIDTRTRLGGHAISVDDILRRWHSSLKNLREAARIAHKIIVLDNSSTVKRFSFVAEIVDGLVSRNDSVPMWVLSTLDEINSCR